jgi:hypothetical protein
VLPSDGVDRSHGRRPEFNLMRLWGSLRDRRPIGNSALSQTGRAMWAHAGSKGAVRGGPSARRIVRLSVKTPKVREKVEAFCVGLTARTVEVKQRCRKNLQGQAGAFGATFVLMCAETKDVDHTLRSVQEKHTPGSFEQEAGSRTGKSW